MNCLRLNWLTCFKPRCFNPNFKSKAPSRRAQSANAAARHSSDPFRRLAVDMSCLTGFCLVHQALYNLGTRFSLETESFKGLPFCQGAFSGSGFGQLPLDENEACRPASTVQATRPEPTQPLGLKSHKRGSEPSEFRIQNCLNIL